MKKFLLLALIVMGGMVEGRPYNRENDWPRYYDTGYEVEQDCGEEKEYNEMNFQLRYREETSWPTNMEDPFFDSLTR